MGGERYQSGRGMIISFFVIVCGAASFALLLLNAFIYAMSQV